MASAELSAGALTYLALGGMLLAGLAADALGRRTPLPGVTILLCMGVAVGPVGLDLLPPEREAWFPIVSSIALVMIGFLIGGEFTRERLRDVGPAILVIAVVQAAVTFATLAAGLMLLGFGQDISLALTGIGTATAAPAPCLEARLSGTAAMPNPRAACAVCRPPRRPFHRDARAFRRRGPSTAGRGCSARHDDPASALKRYVWLYNQHLPRKAFHRRSRQSNP